MSLRIKTFHNGFHNLNAPRIRTSAFGINENYTCKSKIKRAKAFIPLWNIFSFNIDQNFELQIKAIYVRSECGKGRGSTLISTSSELKFEPQFNDYIEIKIINVCVSSCEYAARNTHVLRPFHTSHTYVVLIFIAQKILPRLATHTTRRGSKKSQKERVTRIK